MSLVPLFGNQPVRQKFSDDECMRILGGFRPSYYTAVGLVTADFHKFTRLHNGSMGALYDVRQRNPLSGKQESTRYLYGVDRSGSPKELKRMSTLIR